MTQRASPFILLRKSAFTLLDLLTALAIFAVLAAIAIPNLGAYLPAYRLNNAVRQVQSELHRIKSQAVARSTDFRIVFLPPSFYRIDRKVSATIYEPIGENKALPEGIAYGSATSVSFINLTSRGTATGGTVQLCNSRREGKSVIVFGSSGRIRITSGHC